MSSLRMINIPSDPPPPHLPEGWPEPPPLPATPLEPAPSREPEIMPPVGPPGPESEPEPLERGA